jgi:hypothetical protein
MKHLLYITACAGLGERSNDAANSRRVTYQSDLSQTLIENLFTVLVSTQQSITTALSKSYRGVSGDWSDQTLCRIRELKP